MYIYINNIYIIVVLWISKLYLEMANADTLTIHHQSVNLFIHPLNYSSIFLIIPLYQFIYLSLQYSPHPSLHLPYSFLLILPYSFLPILPSTYITVFYSSFPPPTLQFSTHPSLHLPYSLLLILPSTYLTVFYSSFSPTTLQFSTYPSFHLPYIFTHPSLQSDSRDFLELTVIRQ